MKTKQKETERAFEKITQHELFPKEKTRWDYIEWDGLEKSKKEEKGRWCGCCYESELESFIGKYYE